MLCEVELMHINLTDTIASCSIVVSDPKLLLAPSG